MSIVEYTSPIAYDPEEKPVSITLKGAEGVEKFAKIKVIGKN